MILVNRGAGSDILGSWNGVGARRCRAPPVSRPARGRPEGPAAPGQMRQPSSSSDPSGIASRLHHEGGVTLTTGALHAGHLRHERGLSGPH